MNKTLPYILVIVLSMISPAFAVEDYFLTYNAEFIQPFGPDLTHTADPFGFDFVNIIPSTISPNQQVTVDLQWVFIDQGHTGAIVYLNAFGDWNPGTELARLINGQSEGSVLTGRKNFTFQAPSTPGEYRIRVVIVWAFAPVKNFYGSPPNGQYDPGVGPYTEVKFTVGATVTLTVDVNDFLSDLPLEGATVTAGGKPPTQTYPHGRYEFTGLPVGPISVTASYPGFLPKSELVNAEPHGTPKHIYLYPENRVAIPTDFTPSDFTPCQHGFHFHNWTENGDMCMGMCLAASNLYRLKVPPIRMEEDPKPSDDDPQIQLIRKLQGIYGIQLAAVVSRLSQMPFFDSVFAENQYDIIRGYLKDRVPCPIALTEDLIGGTNKGHAVLAYKILEYAVGTSKAHVIFVYNPNSPCPAYGGDQERIVIIESNGGWKMKKYGDYGRFAVPEPFSSNFFSGSFKGLDAFLDLLFVFWASLDSPATLRVVDPDGLVIDPAHPELDGGYYRIIDVDDDGHQEDVAFSLVRKAGTYGVQVIPNPGASPTDTYTLEVGGDGERLMLAENVPIGNAPRQPYLVLSTESGLVAVVTQPVDDLVAVTVGRAALDAKTGRFSVNVTVNNKSSTAIGTPVWLVIDSISSLWVTPVNTSGTTLDGKPYIDLSGLLGDGNLDPTETVTQRVFFSNPSRVSFTFKPSVRGMILP